MTPEMFVVYFMVLWSLELAHRAFSGLPARPPRARLRARAVGGRDGHPARLARTARGEPRGQGRLRPAKPRNPASRIGQD